MEPTVFLVASSGGAVHPLIDIDGTVFLQFGVFVVTALIATRLLFRPYLEMRAQRDAGITGAKEDASRLTAEADAALSDYEMNLEKARLRAAHETREVRARGAAHRSEVMGAARAQASQAVEEASLRVHREVEQARAELLPQADMLAKDIVAKLLGRGAR